MRFPTHGALSSQSPAPPPSRVTPRTAVVILACSLSRPLCTSRWKPCGRRSETVVAATDHQEWCPIVKSGIAPPGIPASSAFFTAQLQRSGQ